MCWLLSSVAHYPLRGFLHDHLYKVYACSRSYKYRLAYLDFCCVARGRLSQDYFRGVFLGSLVGLGKDKIQNVQLAFCRALEPIAAWLQADDIKHLERLDKSLRDLEKMSLVLRVPGVVQAASTARSKLWEARAKSTTE